MKVPQSTAASIIPEVRDKRNSYQSFFFCFSFEKAGSERLLVIEADAVKCRDKLDKNLMQGTRDLRLGRTLTFQQNSD